MLPDPIDDDPQLPRHPRVTLVRERRCAFGEDLDQGAVVPEVVALLLVAEPLPEDLATLLVVAQDRGRIVELVSA